MSRPLKSRLAVALRLRGRLSRTAAARAAETDFRSDLAIRLSGRGLPFGRALDIARRALPRGSLVRPPRRRPASPRGLRPRGAARRTSAARAPPPPAGVAVEGVPPPPPADDARAVGLFLLDRGFAVVPVRGKVPTDPRSGHRLRGWTRLDSATRRALVEVIRPGDGIGIGLVLGLQPNGLHLVALDPDDLARLPSAFVDSLTESESLRSFSPRSGAWRVVFAVSPDWADRFGAGVDLLLPPGGGKAALQVLGCGRQLVLTGPHPDGGEYRLSPAAVADLPDDLLDTLLRLDPSAFAPRAGQAPRAATANRSARTDGPPNLQVVVRPLNSPTLRRIAELVSPLWTVGRRHLATLSLSGNLRRLGISEEQVRALVESVAVRAGDDDLADRLRAVDTTYSKSIDEISGRRALIEVFGEEAAQRITEVASKSTPLNIPPPEIDMESFPTDVIDARLCRISGSLPARMTCGKFTSWRGCLRRSDHRHGGRAFVRPVCESCGRRGCTTCFPRVVRDGAAEIESRWLLLSHKSKVERFRPMILSPPPHLSDDPYFREILSRRPLTLSDLRRRASSFLRRGFVPLGRRRSCDTRTGAQTARAALRHTFSRLRRGEMVPFTAVAAATLIFHPFRRSHWLLPPDGLKEARRRGGDDWLRALASARWHWSPHFHLITFGFFRPSVAQELRDSGWVLAEHDPDEESLSSPRIVEREGKTHRNLYLFSGYLLSHSFVPPESGEPPGGASAAGIPTLNPAPRESSKGGLSINHAVTHLLCVATNVLPRPEEEVGESDADLCPLCGESLVRVCYLPQLLGRPPPEIPESGAVVRDPRGLWVRADSLLDLLGMSRWHVHASRDESLSSDLRAEVERWGLGHLPPLALSLEVRRRLAGVAETFAQIDSWQRKMQEANRAHVHELAAAVVAARTRAQSEGRFLGAQEAMAAFLGVAA